MSLREEELKGIYQLEAHGIQLPFTYIGRGKMEYIEGSEKPNGAHLFRISMELTAPEDIYFDFKLPE